MFNYDELFAVGNILGIKNTSTGKIENSFVHNKNDKECLIEDFGVDTLDYPLANEQIWYVARLDEQGNATTLFNREKDMVTPRPELKTGMFVKVAYYNEHNKQFEFNSAYGDGLLGVIIDKNIIYSNGLHDYINNATQQYIAEIYEEECFNSCNYPVWRHPEYQKYLDSKTNLEDKEE